MRPRAKNRCRVAVVTLCVILLGVAHMDTARAEETARCPRCEHRFVTDVRGEGRRGTAKGPCRVCRVQWAAFNVEGIVRKHARAVGEAERRAVRAEWEALRHELQGYGYALGEFGDVRGPRLLAPGTPEALSRALFDEALRFQRRATWSGQMAQELKAGRATWRRLRLIEGGDAKRADWTFDDRVAAFEERAALYATVADLYRRQARDLSRDLLNVPLPTPATPPEPGGAIAPGSVVELVETLRKGVRVLIVLEHAALQRLLGQTRGVETGTTPPASRFERMRELHGDAFSTALLSSMHHRRAREIELLRSNLLTDGTLDDFFERAPLLANALRRQRRPR